MCYFLQESTIRIREEAKVSVYKYTVPVYNEQQNEVVHHSVYHSLRKKKKESLYVHFFANRIMAGASAIERKKKV